jgi:hypothetical protein
VVNTMNLRRQDQRAERCIKSLSRMKCEAGGGGGGSRRVWRVWRVWMDGRWVWCGGVVVCGGVGGLGLGVCVERERCPVGWMTE